MISSSVGNMVCSSRPSSPIYLIHASSRPLLPPRTEPAGGPTFGDPQGGTVRPQYPAFPRVRSHQTKGEVATKRMFETVCKRKRGHQLRRPLGTLGFH